VQHEGEALWRIERVEDDEAHLQHFYDQGWLRRKADRVIDVTPRGHRDLLPRLIESPE